MGRQLACIRTFYINGQGPLKRQVTCVPTKMRQLNRQLRVREVAAVRMSVRLSGAHLGFRTITSKFLDQLTFYLAL